LSLLGAMFKVYMFCYVIHTMVLDGNE